MTPSEATNAVTRSEWRELGFFYDVDEATRQWRLVGSPGGLRAFSGLLHVYCSKPRNAAKSEHDHYGPYMYLTIMTWPTPGIDGGSIHGTIDDLTRLARIVEQRLQNATPGDVIPLAEAFAPGCEFELVLEIRDDGFDPAEVDPCLR